MTRAHPRSTTVTSDANDIWEQAYLRFETPEEEVQKFRRRLLRLGANEWHRDWIIADLFCGRGGGARALRSLGFPTVIGLDLSARLVQSGDQSLWRAQADCRAMPLASGSFDVAIVQGGLHHLPQIPTDLDRVLTEIARILRPGGLLVAVEPWRTPFLDLVHRVSEWPLVRRVFPKIDALATMIENERVTYQQWLDMPHAILDLLSRRFEVRERWAALGKLYFVGARR